MSINEELYILDEIYFSPFYKLAKFIPRTVSPYAMTITNVILINIMAIFKIYSNPVVFSQCIFVYWIIDTLNREYMRQLKAEESQYDSDIYKNNYPQYVNKCIDAYSIILIVYMLLLSYLPHYSSNIIHRCILLLIYLVDIPYVIDKYTTTLSKTVGVKYLSMDDCFFILGIFPLLNFFVFSPELTKIILKVQKFFLMVFI